MDSLEALQRSVGHEHVDKDFPEHYQELLLSMMHLQLERMGRKLFDSTHPVDEYAFLPNPNFQQPNIPVTWQPDYEQEVRIESITYSLPIGITAPDLQLGQRHIPLLGVGAATTAQTTGVLMNQGIIINRSDTRQLTFTGTPTSGHYIALAGYLLERHGNL